MKSVARCAIALAAFATCAAPAHASWDATQWGTSVKEALAAVEGARKHSPDASEIYEYGGVQYQPLVKADYTIGGVAGEVSLLFAADETLQFVVFSPVELTECDALTDALMTLYGTVEPTGFGSTAIYNWDDGETIVRHTNSVDIGICTLSFESV